MSNDPLFPGRDTEYSKAGNAMIAGAMANSGRSYGTLAARESGVLDPEAARERLSACLSDVESAKARGNAEQLGLAERRLDLIIDESRASRGEQPRNEDGTYAEPPSFDGGIRRGGVRPRPGAGTVESTANALFASAIRRSREEKAAQRGDPGQTIIANI